MIDATKLKPIGMKEALTRLVQAQRRYAELLAALGLDPATTEHAEAVAVLEALRGLLYDD